LSSILMPSKVGDKRGFARIVELKTI